MSLDETLNSGHKDSAAEEDSSQAQPLGKHANTGSSGAAHAKKRPRKGLRILLIVVLCIALVFGILFGALAVFANSGKSELLADSESSLTQKVYRNGKYYVLNENMVSIAVLGTDRLYGYVPSDENGSADAVLVLACDTETGKMTLINIPRNIVTTFNYSLDGDKDTVMTSFIAAAYSYGNNDAEGSQLVCGAISNLFSGVPVKNYVTLLESCIGPLTDAIGGVTLTAASDSSGTGLSPGETYTLTGEQALRYVQYRNIHIMNSPTGRSHRQQEFAKAFVHQAAQAIKKDPSVIMKLYDIITNPDYMTTNLNMNELTYLVTSALIHGTSDIEMVTVPFDSEYSPITHLTSYTPREDELTDLLISVYYNPAE